MNGTDAVRSQIVGLGQAVVDAGLVVAAGGNIAVRLDGRWWTPPLQSGCLPGVERGRLIDRKKLRERVLYPADLWRAERIAVLSSLRGWRRATLAGALSTRQP